MSHTLATLDSMSLARSGTTFHGPHVVTLTKNSDEFFSLERRGYLVEGSPYSSY